RRRMPAPRCEPVAARGGAARGPVLRAARRATGRTGVLRTPDPPGRAPAAARALPGAAGWGPAMTPLTVLITNTALVAPGGTERVVADLALGLLARGHRPVVFSTRLGPFAH